MNFLHIYAVKTNGFNWSDAEKTKIVKRLAQEHLEHVGYGYYALEDLIDEGEEIYYEKKIARKLVEEFLDDWGLGDYTLEKITGCALLE